jgi:hypothetical protein
MAPRFSLGQVETGKENLDALPEAGKDMREVGLRDAIRLLAPTIRKLEAKGYSQPKIVELLAEQGITISLSTLKEYLRETTRKRAKGGAAPAGTPTTATVAAAPAASAPPSAPPKPASDRAAPAPERRLPPPAARS